MIIRSKAVNEFLREQRKENSASAPLVMGPGASGHLSGRGRAVLFHVASLVVSVHALGRASDNSENVITGIFPTRRPRVARGPGVLTY